MKRFLVVALVFLLANSCKEKVECEREIYLIPDGFKGKVIVFFNQEDGQVQQFENDARLYKIPASGVIKSQFPKNGGCMGDNRILFFYEDSTGQRKPIKYFLDMDRDSIPVDENYVLFTFLSEQNSEPEFVIHFVGELKEFKELTQSARYLDPVSILDSL